MIVVTPYPPEEGAKTHRVQLGTFNSTWLKELILGSTALKPGPFSGRQRGCCRVRHSGGAEDLERPGLCLVRMLGRPVFGMSLNEPWGARGAGGVSARPVDPGRGTAWCGLQSRGIFQYCNNNALYLCVPVEPASSPGMYQSGPIKSATVTNSPHISVA